MSKTSQNAENRTSREPAPHPCRAVDWSIMTRSITSPNHLRDTQLLRTIAEMREADRLAPSEDEEPDEHRHVCLTCRRFTALGRYDRMTLNTLHLRYDDLEAIMSGVGICAGVMDDEDRAPLLVLAEDGTCGEWEGPCA